MGLCDFQCADGCAFVLGIQSTEKEEAAGGFGEGACWARGEVKKGIMIKSIYWVIKKENGLKSEGLKFFKFVSSIFLF